MVSIDETRQNMHCSHKGIIALLAQWSMFVVLLIPVPWGWLVCSDALAVEAYHTVLQIAAKDKDEDEDSTPKHPPRHHHAAAKDEDSKKHPPRHHPAAKDKDEDEDSTPKHPPQRHHAAAKDEDEDEATPPKHRHRHAVAPRHPPRHHVVERHPPVVRQPVQPPPTVEEEPPAHVRHMPLRVSAAEAMVVQEDTGETLFEKNSDRVTPIASVTKLMTAMVVLDRNLPMDDEIEILEEDVDHMKHSSSRLQVGTVLTRREALQLALMSSENRAAASLGRTYPGGMAACVEAMNRKAQELKMSSSYFADPTGLNSANVSTAEDLVKMVRAARRYDSIHEITTTASYEAGVGRKKRPTLFINTNRLVRNGELDIGLSKTGYISEAGHCLVMQVQMNGVPVILTLLDNPAKYGCQADALRIRQWFQHR